MTAGCRMLVHSPSQGCPGPCVSAAEWQLLLQAMCLLVVPIPYALPRIIDMMAANAAVVVEGGLMYPPSVDEGSSRCPLHLDKCNALPEPLLDASCQTAGPWTLIPHLSSGGPMTRCMQPPVMLCDLLSSHPNAALRPQSASPGHWCHPWWYM